MHNVQNSEYYDEIRTAFDDNLNGILLEYPTTTGFQWGHLKNGPYTYTVSEKMVGFL